MNRSISVTALRSSLSNVVNKAETSEIELFQNEVLRPILKFQNELIKSVFVGSLNKQEIDFSKINHQGRLDYITRVIQKDLGLRNVLIGVVLGMMTVDEIFQYYLHENEYRRRISKMVIERLADQLG
jgi:hypothetical protein